MTTNEVEEAAVKQALVEELKTLRKGAGVTSQTSLASTHVLRIMTGDNIPRLQRLLDDELNRDPIAEFGALSNALALESAAGRGRLLRTSEEAADLTKRRDSFARRFNISERTLIRQEDTAIDTLAGRLAHSFCADATLVARFEELPPWQRPRTESAQGSHSAGKRPAKLDRFVRSAPAATAAQDAPSDIPGMIRAQDRKITALTLTLTAAVDDLMAMHEMNRRLAAQWGIQLD